MKGSRSVPSTLLRARLLLPATAPPIHDGALWIVGGRIRACGRWQDHRHLPASTVQDLGDVTVLPGLINAHCHLDYTTFAGQLTPTRSFTRWIHSINAAKAERSSADWQQSWLAGANMLLRNGTTAVADVESCPDLQPRLRDQTALRVFSFLELIRIRTDPPPEELLARALAWIEAVRQPARPTGLSPHAPYSTTPALLELCARLARRRRLPLTLHLAESAEEFDMFLHQRGPLHDWLAANGRNMTDGGASPVRRVAETGLLSPRLLAVHVNYLAPGDLELLTRAGVSIAHCPRSHAFFDHHPFPFQTLRDAGLNLCLGTDSLATVRTTRHPPVELDLRAEARAFAAAHPTVSPADILRLITVNPARALGLAGSLGELRAGTRADLTVLHGRGSAPTLEAAVLDPATTPCAVMVDGSWIWTADGPPSPSSPAPTPGGPARTTPP